MAHSRLAKVMEGRTALKSGKFHWRRTFPLGKLQGMDRPPEGPKGRKNRLHAVRARGKILDRQALRDLQAFVARRKDRTLREISLDLCRHWQWRRPNGELRERACNNLLLRLARSGRLRLPPPLQKHLRLRRCPRTARSVCLGAEEILWPSDSFGGRAEPMSVVVRPIMDHEKPAWDHFMERHHYLGLPHFAGECIRYVAVLAGQAVALLGWAAAALKCGPRDRYLGWDPSTRIENLHLVANNVRFLLLPGQHPKHLASRILSANLRRLGKDWEAAFDHPVYLAETFVDPSRFQGTCYRASNWLLAGETLGWSKHGAGYRHHGAKKLVFLYPLHRKAKEFLLRKPEQLQKQEAKRIMAETLDVNRLPIAGAGGLFDVLGQIADSRKRRGIRHPLISILAIAACATLCGARGFAAIAQWAAHVTPEVRLKLGCRRKRPPSESSFRRILRVIGLGSFEAQIGEWFGKQRDLEGKGVALDGKTLCGSADEGHPPAHLVSLQTHEEGLVLGEVRVPDKTNEIKAVKPLLEPVDLKGAVLTADAMHAQKDTAKYIVEEKKADYILCVKENQPTLLEDIKLVPFGDFSPSVRDGEQGSRPPGDSKDQGERDPGRVS